MRFRLVAATGFTVILSVILLLVIPSFGLYVLLNMFPLGFVSLIVLASIPILFKQATGLIDSQLVSQYTKVRWTNIRYIQKLYPITFFSIVEICNKHKISEPKIGIVNDEMPIAFTYGSSSRNCRIIVSSKLLSLMKDEEIAAVCAHELGHIANYDFVLMTLIQSIRMSFYRFLYSFARTQMNSNNFWYRLILLSAFFALHYIGFFLSLYLSRTREFFADQFAAENIENPDNLSKALAKIAYATALIENSNSLVDGVRALNIFDSDVGRSISSRDTENQIVTEDLLLSATDSLLSTHPPLIKRIYALSNYSKRKGVYLELNLTEPISEAEEAVLNYSDYERHLDSIQIDSELMSKLSFLKISKDRIRQFLALISILFLLTGAFQLVENFQQTVRIQDWNFAIISLILGLYGVTKCVSSLFKHPGFIFLSSSGLLIRRSDFLWKQAERIFFDWSDIEDISVYVNGSDKEVVFNLSENCREAVQEFSSLLDRSIDGYDFNLGCGYVKEPEEICHTLKKWQISFVGLLTQCSNSERDEPQTLPILPTTQPSISEIRTSASTLQRQRALDLGGEWSGTLVGTSGSLNYNFSLYQNGNQIEGTARAIDPINPQRYVVFNMIGAVSTRTLEFEQYEIAEGNPPTDWCLIAGTLNYMNLSNGEFLQGNWSTRSVNVNPMCVGIVGQLNLKKR